MNNFLFLICPEYGEAYNMTNLTNFERMKLFCNKFEQSSMGNAAFYPEYVTSKKINEMVESIPNFSKSDAEKVVDILNKMYQVEHYDGSMWLDYRIHVAKMLSMKGFRTDWVDQMRLKLI
jgi:hypothetical protein